MYATRPTIMNNNNEQNVINLRQDYSLNCAIRIARIIQHHLTINSYTDISQMSEEQLCDLIYDILLLINEIRIYGDILPDIPEKLKEIYKNAI